MDPFSKRSACENRPEAHQHAQHDNHVYNPELGFRNRPEPPLHSALPLLSQLPLSQPNTSSLSLPPSAAVLLLTCWPPLPLSHGATPHSTPCGGADRLAVAQGRPASRAGRPSLSHVQRCLSLSPERKRDGPRWLSWLPARIRSPEAALGIDSATVMSIYL
jgi:hypothetical protein